MIYTNKTEKILPYCKKLGKSKDAMWKFSNIAQAIFFFFSHFGNSPRKLPLSVSSGSDKTISEKCVTLLTYNLVRRGLPVLP